MGLFSASTTVVFGSVVYNLAGPESKRANYLKTTVLGAVIHDAPSIPDLIQTSYITGPGIKLRNFAKWANTSGLMTATGQTNSSITLSQSVNQGTLATLLPVTAGQTVVIQTSSIGLADYTKWADQYVAVNNPTLVGTAYTASYDITSNTITVAFVGGTSASFTPTGYDPTARYLYSAYNYTTGSSSGPVVTGSTVSTGGGAMPSTTGWTSDTPVEPGTTLWERTVYQGRSTDGTSLKSQRQIMTQNAAAGTYRIDTQDITDATFSNINVLIYKQGSGNAAMDALFVTASSSEEFFPFIPVRIANKFVSPSFLGDVYTPAKKGLKKAINGDLDKIITDIGANSSLAYIDNAYIVFGVSLNTAENASRKYIYKFFQRITAGQDMADPAYLAWQAAWLAADAGALTWKNWAAAQDDNTNPLWGTTEPDRPTYPAAPVSSVQVNSFARTGINYASTVQWTGIIETTGSGLLNPTAVPGQLWFETILTSSISPTLNTQLDSIVGVKYGYMQKIRLNWQVDANNWRYLDIYGLQHTHLLYGTDSIVTTGVEALADTSESGFIIPLNQTIYNDISLIDATQMSTACAYIVFTTAVAHKTSWFASGIFQVLVVVAVIIIAVVVTVYTGGVGTVGLLGTAGSVGTALGATGVTALILGSIVNSIAAMVLSKVLMAGATAVFGDKIGPLIGAIASIVATAEVSSLATGTDISSNFVGMSLVKNLLKLTMATGDGIKQYMDASTQDTLKETQSLLTSYNQDSLAIQTQTDALLGTNGIIDPTALFDSTTQSSQAALLIESATTFLTRTLMTGSDLAELSNDMLNNFSDLTITTTLPG